MTTLIKQITKIFYVLNNIGYVGRYYLYLILIFRKIIRKLRLNNRIKEVDLIKKYLDFINEPSGTVFDIGASTGSFLENFLSMKWSIFAFEPDPNPIKRYSLEYFQKYYNIKYIEKACSSSSGDEDNHYIKGYYKRGMVWRIPDYKGEELAYSMAKKSF